MHETRFALHIHTTYSDGTANHRELINIAEKAGLDGIITTDHNIWVEGLDGYYEHGKKKTMLLVGEEVHNQKLNPPGNHLLVIGAERELSPFANDPQLLINQVNHANGLCFLAHPIEDKLESFNEKAFSWRDWDVHSFTGIEIWNQLSEFKSVTHNFYSAAVNALSPKRMTLKPLEQTLKLWDELIVKRKRPIVAVGGVDAHRLIKKFGPIRIQLYPYLHHFKSITTHILTPKPPSGEFDDDRGMILDALRNGHCFVAYDLPASTEGFRFSVDNDDGHFIMGDSVQIQAGMTFQIRLPQKANCRLIKDGKLIKEWTDREICTYITKDPGVYRVEVYIPYKGKLRGWIFSNPIYVRATP
jgi:hypothetical protein